MLRVFAAAVIAAVLVVIGMALVAPKSIARSSRDGSNEPAAGSAVISADPSSASSTAATRRQTAPETSVPVAVGAPEERRSEATLTDSESVEAMEVPEDEPTDAPSSDATDLPEAVDPTALPVDEEPEEPAPSSDASDRPSTTERDELDPEPRTEPAPTAKPKRVRVLLYVEGVTQGEIRIGQGTVRPLDPLARLKLRPGTYPLSWRAQPSDAWQKVESLHVAVDDPTKQYVFARISRDGTVLRNIRNKPQAGLGR